MAQPERTLDNPVTGERLVFRRTTADTNGEALEYELVFKPQGFVVQEHLHPHQSERHEVIAGELGLRLPGGKRVLRPGDAVDVPAATPHRLFAVGDERVHDGAGAASAGSSCGGTDSERPERGKLARAA